MFLNTCFFFYVELLENINIPIGVFMLNRNTFAIAVQKEKILSIRVKAVNS